MTKRTDGPWAIRGPYEDGTFALIEQVGNEYFSRGLLKTRAEARARHREILAERADALKVGAR